MNHWEILGLLTFSLELGCTPLMGSACLRKHGSLAYEMHLKVSVWMEGAVWARQSAWDRSHLSLLLCTMTELPVTALIPVTHPTKMGYWLKAQQPGFASICKKPLLLLFKHRVKIIQSSKTLQRILFIIVLYLLVCPDYSWDRNAASDLLCPRSGVDIT